MTKKTESGWKIKTRWSVSDVKIEDDERFVKNGERKLDDLRNLNNNNKKKYFWRERGRKCPDFKKKDIFQDRKWSNLKTFVFIIKKKKLVGAWKIHYSNIEWMGKT